RGFCRGRYSCSSISARDGRQSGPRMRLRTLSKIIMLTLIVVIDERKGVSMSLVGQPAPLRPELQRGDQITIRILGVVTAVATLAAALWPTFLALHSIAPGETTVQLLTRVEVPNEGTPGGPGIVSAGY